MASRICGVLTATLIAGLCAQAIFPSAFVRATTGTFFILLLAMGAVIVGQIPRLPRRGYALRIRRVIGLAAFAVEIALFVWACRMMLVLREPLWIDIIGYLWILAYLTWKVVLHPNSPSGGWPLRGRPQPEPLGLLPQSTGLAAHAHRDTGTTVMSGIAALRHHLVIARPPSPPYAVRDTGSAVLRGLASLRFGSR